MTLQSPQYLWLLLAVGMGVALEVVFAVRSYRASTSFSSPELFPLVAPRRPGARRIVSAVGLLLTLLVLVVACARPARSVQVPQELSTVIIALDSSASMGSTDVPPSRIEVAQAAAERFVRALPRGPLVGYVDFSGSSSIEVPPTYDRFAVLEAISETQLSSGTAIGEAIVSSIDAVAITVGLPDVDSPKAHPAHLPPSAVVLLSDGDTNAGRPPEAGSALAKKYGVPVSTIAYGTKDGTAIINGLKQTVPVNVDALREIARTTGGHFFQATNASELTTVYHSLGSEIGYRTEYRDISVWFVVVALALALVTAALSLVWFARMP
jgi:Ca-activated chloride channel family protein